MCSIQSWEVFWQINNGIYILKEQFCLPLSRQFCTHSLFPSFVQMLLGPENCNCCPKVLFCCCCTFPELIALAMPISIIAFGQLHNILSKLPWTCHLFKQEDGATKVSWHASYAKSDTLAVLIPFMILFCTQFKDFLRWSGGATWISP